MWGKSNQAEGTANTEVLECTDHATSGGSRGISRETQVDLSFIGPCKDGQGRRESPLCA